jgi:hypothetical protein
MFKACCVGGSECRGPVELLSGRLLPCFRPPLAWRTHNRTWTPANPPRRSSRIRVTPAIAARGKSRTQAPRFCGNIIPPACGKPRLWPHILQAWGAIRVRCSNGGRRSWAPAKRLPPRPTRQLPRKPRKYPSPILRLRCRGRLWHSPRQLGRVDPVAPPKAWNLACRRRLAGQKRPPRKLQRRRQ